jgi:hypothetical protein
VERAWIELGGDVVFDFKLVASRFKREVCILSSITMEDSTDFVVLPLAGCVCSMCGNTTL